MPRFMYKTFENLRFLEYIFSSNICPFFDFTASFEARHTFGRFSLTLYLFQLSIFYHRTAEFLPNLLKQTFRKAASFSTPYSSHAA